MSPVGCMLAALPYFVKYILLGAGHDRAAIPVITTLHRLVEAGNTVVVVEHNLDVIAEADWIIDLGPEAGAAGGRIVAQGTPATIAAAGARSHTGAVLAPFLAARSP